MTSSPYRKRVFCRVVLPGGPYVLPTGFGSDGFLIAKLSEFEGGLGVIEMRGDDTAVSRDIQHEALGFFHTENVTSRKARE